MTMSNTSGGGNFVNHWNKKDALEFLKECGYKNLEKLTGRELIHLASCVNNGIEKVFAKKELNKII